MRHLTRSCGLALHEPGGRLEAISGVAAAGDAEAAPQRSHVHSYCCLDYPRLMDVVQLRLHRLRARVREAVSDKRPVQVAPRPPRCVEPAGRSRSLWCQ
jgi:hypothetical protein